ncbi:hypothetical protein JW890_01325 [candidate division WOR-3 bacterium]|nr:hypothetical protein [candidate division WOR-3 bacterium]
MIYEKIVQKQESFSVMIRNTEVSGVKSTHDTKTGMRAYEGGKLGITGLIGPADDDELKRTAQEALKTAVEYPFEPTGDRQDSWEYTNEKFLNEELLDKTHDLLSELKKRHSEFDFSNSVTRHKEKIRMSNDAGLGLSYIDDNIASILFFKQKTSLNILDGYIFQVSRSFHEEEILRLSDMFCSGYLTQCPLKAAKKHNVVFLTGSLSEFSFFSEHLNGLNVGMNTSSLSHKRGEKVFNEGFTLLQTKNPALTYSQFFDSEGTVNPGYEFALIEKGVFINPYSDKRTSAKFGFVNTGAANFQFDGAPVLASPNFRAKSTVKTLKELTGGEHAILVYILSGGDFTPEGNFGSPVQLAFLLENGEIKGRLPQLQIKSNVFDMFGKDFIGITKEKLSEYSPDQYLAVRMEVSEI